jgi:hypothetical protein
MIGKRRRRRAGRPYTFRVERASPSRVFGPRDPVPFFRLARAWLQSSTTKVDAERRASIADRNGCAQRLPGRVGERGPNPAPTGLSCTGHGGIRWLEWGLAGGMKSEEVGTGTTRDPPSGSISGRRNMSTGASGLDDRAVARGGLGNFNPSRSLVL